MAFLAGASGAALRFNLVLDPATGTGFGGLALSD